MLFHHFFMFDGWRGEGNVYTYLLSYDKYSVPLFLGIVGKLCVALFAFTAGYALWLSRGPKTNWRKIFLRIAKILVAYWLIFAIFLIIGYFLGMKLPNLKTVFLNAFGLRMEVLKLSVVFGWFVFFYILLQLTSPIIIYLFTRFNDFWKDLLLWACSFPILYFAGFTHLMDFYTFIPAFLGLLAAKYKIFSWLNNRFSHYPIIAFVCAILLVFIIRFFLCINHFYMIQFYDSFLCVVFIYSSIEIIHRIKSRWLTKVLVFIGLNSMNIWFLHGIFFMGNNSIQTILYSPKYWLAIFCWGLIMTLMASIICNKLQEPLINSVSKLLSSSKYYPPRIPTQKKLKNK